MPRPFRFGVNMLTLEAGDSWRRKCRRAEELGYDVLLVPDHLGMPAPFPALIAAAEATERPRVGTFVLNAGFWNPALLAREVATTDALTGGRLELGLGTGYVRAEHETAGLPWGSPRERVDHLVRTIGELDRLLGDPDQVPRPAQRPRPPLLVGGNGPRMLRLAAEHAEIAAFTGGRQAPGRPEGTLELMPADELAASVARYEGYAAGRPEPAERNLLVQQVRNTHDRRAVAREIAARGIGLDEEQALEVPTLLIGTPRQMAEQLREHRERFGFSYLTVLDSALEEFAPVMEELRGS
ncbi:TIGR03621 family F420-dependent LLM class oxidoreductase [Streptomyces endophytica]|uniref:TIGR03621 family F420-dependent LLM class oxidoreductase n=1 Tax=Streptomyces endophytica TaxID=2991496 RepID=A0ABY6PGF6_9ACTN|nr:TIGR03621 family F420-dependent LLM class oxidoreductase [Streptomyces endophytica]UZJ32970.1 TIGR03621 family F420-dependent LLM class oxidoreductase [Streptomyces endophytica]